MQAEIVKSHECKTAVPAIREQMGCDKRALNPITLAGVEIDRCPAFYLEQDDGFLSQAFEWYNWRDKGYLPEPGGYLDQSNKFVETCNFMDRLYSEKLKREARV